MKGDTIEIIIKVNMVVSATNICCQTFENHSSEFFSRP